ncbi:MAG: hypothetical protein BWY91_01141 [bacterium ADurb.BinA028]|nr:MAG: hypothetical protein BWY91_01141 [bacterium ADurb.BinA028]
MLVKLLPARRLVVVSPKTTLLPLAPGGPSQMRRLTWLIVLVVVEPVW